MSNVLEREAPAQLRLRANTARDLMTASPVSLGDDATIQEAVRLFTDKGISAAPVIDEAGRPVGVVSHSDIIAHDRERVEHPQPAEVYRPEEVATEEGERLGQGFQVETADRTRVRDIMTPALFSVPPETPAAKVVEQMRALNVHRLFVVDHDGVLIGVISTFDILGRLQP
jgi:CBS domain-containing protein